MQQFVDYIKKQGLVIVESSQLQNQMPKFRKVKHDLTEPSQMGCDNESTVTIYKNAVQRAPVINNSQTQDKKR